MGRKNDKEQLVDYENSIKKSNKLSMFKMNQGITFAIFSIQNDGKTEYRKHEFAKKFSISQL